MSSEWRHRLKEKVPCMTRLVNSLSILSYKQNSLDTAKINLLFQVTGRELPTDHPSVNLINKVDANLSYLSNPGINTMTMLFPWIRHLPFESGRRYQQITRDIKELKGLILKDEQV